jgi:two-component system sensor histidine kinase CiaH
VRGRVLAVLAYTNGVILILSGIAGYYLAGKTLRPIETAMEEQKRFVGDASHELKTPITALQTSIEVTLRDKKLSLKDAKNTLKESLADIEKLKYLTNNLLVLARYQQNGNNMQKQKFNLAEVIDNSIKEISPIAKRRDIKILKKINNIEIIADREAIEKLINNLIDNAVKYNKEHGKVIISTLKKRGNVLIKVKDTGIGIKKNETKRIFERFYQVESSRSKNNVDGFGLGLSMAKRIVDLHNGSIKVNSKVDRGSTFIVRLPLN